MSNNAGLLARTLLQALKIRAIERRVATAKLVCSIVAAISLFTYLVSWYDAIALTNALWLAMVASVAAFALHRWQLSILRRLSATLRKLQKLSA